MEILIHLDTKKIDTDYQKAVDEYIKRTSPFCMVSIKTYKSFEKLTLNKSSEKFILTTGPKTRTSPELAQMIQNINLKGISCIEFLVTDNFQLEKLSHVSEFHISSFSMSIELTTVVLTEQIYRAYTILNNITYHK